MTEFFQEAAKELPALALFSVAIFAVIKAFIKFLEDDRSERRQANELFSETVKAVNEDSKTFHREMKEENKRTEEHLSQVIDRNTNALDENTKAFARIEPVLERLDKQS